MNTTAEARFFRFSIAMEAITKKLQKYKNSQVSSYGLHSMHVMFLCSLYRSENGMTAGELSKACGVDKAFISRTAGDLRKKGYVDFSHGEGKLYKKRMVLTPTGIGVMEKISRVVEETVDKATAGISAEQFEVFYSVMEKLEGNLTSITE